MQTESCSVTPSLQAISTKLEEWRISKKENNTLKARIPNYLWDEISQLFDFYPLSKIRKVLSLNPIQIKSRLKKTS